MERIGAVPGSGGGDIVPPLVVVEGLGEINAMHFFASARALGSHLEPWFPQEEAYRAFDSEGRKLELTVEVKPVRRRWRRDTTYTHVGVRLAESDRLHQDELAELLRRWLSRAHSPIAVENLSLGQLLVTATESGKAIQ